MFWALKKRYISKEHFPLFCLKSFSICNINIIECCLVKVTFISAFLFTEKSFELKRSFSISLANLCGNLCCIEKKNLGRKERIFIYFLLLVKFSAIICACLF